MDQTKIETTVSTLQSFIKDNFVKTPYNDDNEKALVNRYYAVCDKIRQIYNDDQDVLDNVLTWKYLIIPTVDDVGGTGHMQNIGISASLCLKILKNPAHKMYLENEIIRRLVEQFLNIVKKQAQNACSANLKSSTPASLTSEDIENLVKQYIGIYTPDFDHMIAAKQTELDNFFDQKKSEFDDISKKVQTSVDQAEKNAKDAQRNAATVLQNLNGAVKAAKRAALSAKEAEETAKNMLPNMLSALGILVGIVVTVVACYLSILLTKHSGNTAVLHYSRPFEFMQYLLMGHITLAVIFLLMYLISRISGHSLACNCNKFKSQATPQSSTEIPVCDCSKCNKDCSVAVRFKLRYPYLYGINMMCMLGYLVLALWQFVNVYFRADLDKWIQNNFECTLVIISIVLVVLLFIIWQIFRYKGTFK